MLAAGADGCRGGWICVTRDQAGKLSVLCATSAATLVAQQPRPAVLAIDVPIGLLDAGSRGCDREARALLGPRRSSVFTAPIRPVLAAANHEAASDMRREIEGKGMSKQAWGIVPKVREVDALIRADSTLRTWVREVHPELSFMAWNGTPMAEAKKTAKGREARLDLVTKHFGATAFRDARQLFRRASVADDDILDAFAALWTAERVLRGAARVIPKAPPIDAFGLRMEMVY